VIDLRMVVRKDGMTVHQALSDELFGFAVSFTPWGCEPRTMVFRWPLFLTVLLAWLVLFESVRAFIIGAP
jgi:hypothetical protein